MDDKDKNQRIEEELEKFSNSMVNYWQNKPLHATPDNFVQLMQVPILMAQHAKEELQKLGLDDKEAENMIGKETNRISGIISERRRDKGEPAGNRPIILPRSVFSK